MAETTTTLSKLADKLRKNSRVNDSENFAYPNDYNDIVVDAVYQHNPQYSVTEASCNVPLREEYPVVLLSWSMLCVIRASKFASESQGSQGGFSTDRNTPYYKLMDLSKQLKKMYLDVCGALGLDSFAGAKNVHASEVVVENLDLGAMTPVELSLDPPPVLLETVPANKVNDDGTLLVKWRQDLFQNFSHYYLVHKEGTDDLWQEWNFNSKSVPRIHDDAIIVGKINDQEIKAVQVHDLTVTPGTINHFLLIAVSKSGKYSYSVEVKLTQP